MSLNGKKIGIALSGGGYRAAAYHIGTLRALNKLGVLDKVDVISSVSGGSITAAYYVLNRHKGYHQFEKEFIDKLKCGVLRLAIVRLVIVVALIIAVICFTPSAYKVYTAIAVAAVVWFLWYYLFPLSKCIDKAYSLHFFKGATLDNMPKYPILAINATDLSTGNQFTFSQERMACYPYKDKLNFKTSDFPLSKAVMASSCVPHIFSPVKIGKQFYEGVSEIKPLLVDGGLYDNQGAHKFESHDNYFNVDYAIVSDAGNTVISSKCCYNPFKTLLVSVDIMMRRIKNFQRQHNSYIPAEKKRVIFAYNDLMWNFYDEFVKRFVQNIKDGYIPKQVTDTHCITSEMIEKMHNPAISEQTTETVRSIIERNISWNELIAKAPKHHKIAQKVCTNLIGLSDKQINALIEHSEWMTEVQVKMHLPFLVQQIG